MDPEILPEQKEKLESWAAKRDALLSEISVLEDQKNNLTKVISEKAVQSTELDNKILRSEGAIKVMDKHEEEYSGVMANEIGDLMAQKASLNAEIVGLKEDIVHYRTQKDLLIETISHLKDAYDRVFSRTEVLDKVVDHVTRVSGDNIREVTNSLSGFVTALDEATEAQNKNIEKANFVITKVPEVFLELQRQVLNKHKMQ